MDCVFAPHFPSDDDPARFASGHRAFGVDNVARFLGWVALESRAATAHWLVVNAPWRQVITRQPRPSAATSSGGSLPCAACRHLRITCVPECVFARHFPAHDNPARFAIVNATLGTDDVALILCGLAPDEQADAVRKLVAEAPRRRHQCSRFPSSEGRPCAACKHLRRKLEPNCVFPPYFPSNDYPKRFAAAHAVYGASNLARLLAELLPEHRGDAATSFVYEARGRQRDPVLGVARDVLILETALKMIQELVAASRKELARYIGEDAASRPLVPVNMSPMAVTKQELEHGVQAAAQKVMQQSAANAVAGVTNFVTPLHEQLAKRFAADEPGSGAGTTAAVPGPSETAATVHMQRLPSQAPTAAAGVQDPGLPEAEDAGDESSQDSS